MPAEDLIKYWKNEDYQLDRPATVSNPAGDAEREVFVSAGERSTCNVHSMTCAGWCSCL